MALYSSVRKVSSFLGNFFNISIVIRSYPGDFFLLRSFFIICFISFTENSLKGGDSCSGEHGNSSISVFTGFGHV